MQTAREGGSLFQHHTGSQVLYIAIILNRGEELGSSDLSEIIAENFGANATYVEGLLGRFRSNPELVDESWRAYFTELLGNGEGPAPQTT